MLYEVITGVLLLQPFHGAHAQSFIGVQDVAYTKYQNSFTIV